MASGDCAPTQLLYEKVCESYHAVDDFRMKLLGLLPVATGTAVFFLLTGKVDLIDEAKQDVGDALFAIGGFGLLFTVGLFAYELFGIKKCHYLIAAGARLEERLSSLQNGPPVVGQFQSRPRALGNRVNEPFASAVIYPASMAAWLYLALSAQWDYAIVAAAAIVVLGAAGTLAAAQRMKVNQEREDLVMSLVGDGASRKEVRKEAMERWAARCPPGQVKRWREKAVKPSGRWVFRAVRRLQAQHRLEPGGDDVLRPYRGSGPRDDEGRTEGAEVSGSAVRQGPGDTAAAASS
jgi:hypothetical protein